MPGGANLYRCAGDIQFETVAPQLGQICDVRLKQFSETCNFLQYKKALTPEHPYFFAQIRALAKRSIITIGIAGPDMAEDAHPGNWNNTVGYQSNTGRCYSSHKTSANTDGEKFGIGDVFGVLVTYFGKDMSTVMFLKNGQPIATRYLFETDHTKFLPTISLEYGPIELGLMWPEAVMGIPKYSEKNMLHWIKPPCVHYDLEEDSFDVDDKERLETIIQSPYPLSKDIQHFEVVVHEVSDKGEGPTIAISTCSPLKPSPTCKLLRDYFKWHPNGESLKVEKGQRMGWGVHYHPDLHGNKLHDDRAQQLVLCYVTLDTTIVFCQMMLQPAGGWYPLAILHPYASKVQIDMETNPKPVILLELDRLYMEALPRAEKELKADNAITMVHDAFFNRSRDLEVSINDIYTTVCLDEDKFGVHIIQLGIPLKEDFPYFCVEINKLSEDSMLCFGVAPPDFPQNKYPGRLPNSVGYQSRDGKMFYNNKDNGNTKGERFGAGDIVGVEVESFESEAAVALFCKNYRPIGTRFVTIPNRTDFLPTVALYGNFSRIEIKIVWQTRLSTPPIFSVTNLEHWCLPEGSRVDKDCDILYIEEDHSDSKVLQAPYSLARHYNHFEIRIMEEYTDSCPPPAIALCTASPLDPPSTSNFKQDVIRFWAGTTPEGLIKKGDRIGWGLLYPHSKMDEDQLVICYLTINRDVALTRVLFEPPGGFFPVVVLPPGTNKVKMDFSATVIREHPFTPLAISLLLDEARKLIVEEKNSMASGKEGSSESKLSKQLFRPIPAEAAAGDKGDKFQDQTIKERKDPRMVDVVEQVTHKKDQPIDGSGEQCKSTGGGGENPPRKRELIDKYRSRMVEKQRSKTCVIL